MVKYTIGAKEVIRCRCEYSIHSISAPGDTPAGQETGEKSQRLPRKWGCEQHSIHKGGREPKGLGPRRTHREPGYQLDPHSTDALGGWAQGHCSAALLPGDKAAGSGLQHEPRTINHQSPGFLKDSCRRQPEPLGDTARLPCRASLLAKYLCLLWAPEPQHRPLPEASCWRRHHHGQGSVAISSGHWNLGPASKLPVLAEPGG